jgi:hypothetical protein
MSHFTTLKTQMVDEQALTCALADLGFRQVEVHQQAQPLHGYWGTTASATAEVIIRRRVNPQARYDIGFKRRPDGTFEALIVDEDRARYNQQWLDRLTQRYAYHVTRAKLEEQGFTLATEETRQDGQIHLVLRRMA